MLLVRPSLIAGASETVNNAIPFLPRHHSGTGQFSFHDELCSLCLSDCESTGVSLKAVVRGVVCALRLHGAVATGRTNLADIRASNWAGRQEYGTVQAILEHKFLQVLRKDSATMHREQLASHLRRDPPCFAASRLVSAGVEIR